MQENNENLELTEKFDDAKELKEELSEEKEKAEKYLANWQRCQADFINYKKWAEQNKNEIIKFANANLIKEILPLLDDLSVAFNNLPQNVEDEQWIDGIKLIYNKLLTVMKSQEVEEIEAIGKPFDPNFHTAIMCKEGEDGIILEELHKGYTYKNTVLRPSMVIVGKSTIEEKEE